MVRYCPVCNQPFVVSERYSERYGNTGADGACKCGYAYDITLGIEVETMLGHKYYRRDDETWTNSTVKKETALGVYKLLTRFSKLFYEE